MRPFCIKTDPDSSDGHSYKRWGVEGRSRHTDIQGARAYQHRETGIISQGTPRITRWEGQGRPIFEGHWTEYGSHGQHLYFELLASRTMGESSSVALKSLGLCSFVTAVLINIMP